MMICRYFLCFIFYSFIGWVYECVFYSMQHRRFVNSGFLNGCICPIYGIGAMLILIFLSNVENTLMLFLAGMFLTGILEYFTSWFLEQMFHQRWWDYTTWPFNINGRVCVLGAFAFGTMSVLLVKFINPFTQRMIDTLSVHTVFLLTVLCAAAIFTDILFTVRHIDLSEKKLWFVRKQSELMERRKNYLRMRIDNSSTIANVRGLYIRHNSREHQSIVEKIKRIIYR